MNLKENLLRGIYSYGFECPSLIQQKSIVPITSNKDVIVQAASGCGKTAVYVIGTLQLIDLTKNAIQSLILVPTRELAYQVGSVVSALGEYLNVQSYVCVGGTRVAADIENLQKSPHVIIGTTGRILDLIQRKAFDTTKLIHFIVDDADQLLQLAKDMIYDIFQFLPTTIKVSLISTTFPTDVLETTKKFMSPSTLNIKVKGDCDNIKIFKVLIEEDYKLDTLCDIMEDLPSQMMVFANSKRKIDFISDKLTTKNYNTHTSIHDEMIPQTRTENLYNFRTGKYRVLLTTDLLSRGIDVSGVTIVMHYDMPTNGGSVDLVKFVHRNGRCGRFGRKGIVICFATNKEEGCVRDVEELPGKIYDLL